MDNLSDLPVWRQQRAENRKDRAENRKDRAQRHRHWMQNRDWYVFLLSWAGLIVAILVSPDARFYALFGGSFGSLITASGKHLLKTAKQKLKIKD